MQKKRNRVDWKAHGETLLRWTKAAGKSLYHHPVTVIVVLLLVWVVWWFGQNGATSIQEYKGTQVVLTEPEIGQIQLLQMLEQGAKVCAYQTEQNQTVEVRQPKRQADVELCKVIGDMDLLPFTVEEGSLPIDKERQCVIDTETAYKLFGSDNGVHNIVWIGDSWYEVSAVVNSSVPGVFVYEKDMKYTFDRMIVQGKEEQRKAAIGLLPSEKILSQTEYGNVNDTVTYLTQLPIWMAGILFWIVVVFSRKRSIPKTLSVSIVTVLYLYVTGIHFYLPPCLIPDRWSHLEFYPEALQQLKETVFHYLQMIQAGFESQYILCAVRVLLLMIVLVLIEVSVAVHLKKSKPLHKEE